jgi:hypothetical protein
MVQPAGEAVQVAPQPLPLRRPPAVAALEHGHAQLTVRSGQAVEQLSQRQSTAHAPRQHQNALLAQALHRHRLEVVCGGVSARR